MSNVILRSRTLPTAQVHH